MTDILLGFTAPEGKPFYIPKGHIVVTGITQHGKSTTLEAIFKRDPAAKAIVFLTKRGEKTFPDAQRIPPYYKERWDWEYMRGLLEAAMHERLKFETPWIIRISKFSHSIADFRKGLAVELSKPSVREFDKNIYMLLAAYLDKVLPVLEQAKSQLVTYVDLKPGINVVDLTDWYTQEAFQMLIIRAFMEYILEKENNVKIGLLEAWKMLPQNRNTPVKLFFEKFIREGATNDNYLVLDAQDLGGIDKTPLRQVSVWIMGKMMEANEVERLLSQTLGLKVPASDIQTLPLGHFIVATGKTVQKVYAWPDGSPEDMARAVARGERKPEEVKAWLMERQKEVMVQVPLSSFSPNGLVQRVEALERLVPESERRILTEVAKIVKDTNYTPYEALQKRIDDIATELQRIQSVKLPSLHEISTKETINLEHKDLTINVSYSEEQVNMTTETIVGKVLFCAVQLPKEGFSESEIASLALTYGWNIGHSSLAPTIGSLVKDGRFVRIAGPRPTKYRLPEKVKYFIRGE